MVSQTILIVILIFILYWFNRRYKIESYEEKQVKYYRCNKYVFPEVETNVTNQWQKVEDSSWDVWFPCGYTDIEEQIKQNNNFSYITANSIVFGLKNADNFAAKDRLWLALKKYYGIDGATKYMPKSWVTYVNQDIDDFKTYSKQHPEQLYIMKKNIQRQQGLHIFKDAAEIDTAFSNGYVIVQRILLDPYLVNDRKINIRIYILITCTGTRKELYVYNDGFVYYSKEPYTDGKSRDQIITTGYIDRLIYKINPLTVQDFKKFIDKKHGSGTSLRLENLIQTTITGLIQATTENFCKTNGSVTFVQIFGADLQPNYNLTEIHLLELNKGADMEIKDSRDGAVKHGLMRDTFRLLGLLPTNNETNGWNTLWSS